MSRNIRAKKPKNDKLDSVKVSIREAIDMADRSSYNMAKEVMEMFYIVLCAHLTSTPHAYSKEKFLKLKKNMDRSLVGLLNQTFDKELYYKNFAQRGIMKEDLLNVDAEDIEEYLKI